MGTKLRSFGTQYISRRDFLRVGATGIMATLGLSFAPYNEIFRSLNKLIFPFFSQTGNSELFSAVEFLTTDQQGRVINASLDVYDVPSYSGRKLINIGMILSFLSQKLPLVNPMTQLTWFGIKLEMKDLFIPEKFNLYAP
jgi:hypothetical protein